MQKLQSKPYWRNQKSDGFTLIEIIISSTLIALVIVAIYSAFSSGLRLWAKTNQSTFNKEQSLIALERLGKELRSSLNFSSIAFKGENSYLSFPILTSSAQNESTTLYMPANVSYSFDEKKGIISRSVQIYGKDKQPSTREVAGGIASLKFYYRHYDSQSDKWEWFNTFSSIPSAVKIEIVLLGGKNEKEETITRIIAIPR